MLCRPARCTAGPRGPARDPALGSGGIDWFELHDVVGAAGSLMSATFLFYIAFFVAFDLTLIRFTKCYHTIIPDKLVCFATLRYATLRYDPI